jgi:hypothetical protein
MCDCLESWTTWFQHDVATAHTARQSMTFLRQMFPVSLISWSGDTPWPPRSPDLTVPDFFLSKVYATRPHCTQELNDRIIEGTAIINGALLSFIFCTHSQMSLGRWSQWEWGGRGMWHAWERTEICTRFWWERPKERDLFKDRDEDGSMGLEWTLGRLAGRMLNGFNWLRIGAGGGLLWMW